MRTSLILLALLLPLTACGDDEPPVAPSAGARVTASATAAATPTATPTDGPSADPTAGASTAAASSATPVPSAVPTTAAPAAPPAPGAPAPAAPARPPSGGVPRMTGDGIDLGSRVLVFGTSYVAARPPLDDVLGSPTLDTGAIDTFSSYGTCPGQDLRVLEYAGGALRLLFGTLQGGSEMTFYSWVLADDGTPAGVPGASAFIGDVTTVGFGVGTTVAQLQEGLGQALALTPGDELGGPTFRVVDQSSGLFGRLTSTEPAGAVTYVQGGPGCGE